MKNIAVLGSLMGMAVSAMGKFGSALEESSRMVGFDTQGRKPSRRSAQNETGYKLSTQRGTIGLGMHRVNKHGPIKGVTVSPKKDIGKGPAATPPVRGYSTNRQRLKFEKAARRDFKAVKNGGR